jgi:hypothetical protein
MTKSDGPSGIYLEREKKGISVNSLLLLKEEYPEGGRWLISSYITIPDLHFERYLKYKINHPGHPSVIQLTHFVRKSCCSGWPPLLKK